MNWQQAVNWMKLGSSVKRESANTDGVPCEPCCLMWAWTPENQIVRVFIGKESKELFVPTTEDESATDWVVC
jgi:hypothetical protein